MGKERVGESERKGKREKKVGDKFTFEFKGLPCFALGFEQPQNSAEL